MREAVIFLCHLVNDEMLWRYKKLKGDLCRHSDVYWAFQTDNDISDVELRKHGVCIFDFSINELKALGYTSIAQNLIPGSLHHVTLFFYRRHPEYNHYWLVEYDVIFTGNWNDLAERFATDNFDFLTAYVEKYNKRNDEWPWWSSFKCDENHERTPKCLLRSFCPVYRISKRALTYLDWRLQQSGVQGHAEVLLPTVLYDGGFSIMDFGGTGEFVPAGGQNRFYIQGDHPIGSTFRWRPTFSRLEVEGLGITGKLFHPVKC